VSPGLGLALLFVLIGAQLTRVLAPHRLGYVVSLLLAIVGLFAGELFALSTHAGGPTLGAVHPLADALGVAAFELAGALIAPKRHRGP
jgi:hypothetical protein